MLVCVSIHRGQNPKPKLPKPKLPPPTTPRPKMSTVEKGGKPLKGILKTGDEPSKKHVGGISLAVEEGHDAEKKHHKFTFVEGKDGAVVKDADGNIIKEEEVKKSRRSNKEHQMIHKKLAAPPAEENTIEKHPPSPEPAKKEEKIKKKGRFF